MKRIGILLLAFMAMTSTAGASPAYIEQIGANFEANPATMATSLEMLEPTLTSMQTVTTQLNRIDVPVGGLSLISQIGEGNSAEIMQSGSYNLGIIQQIGYQNSALLYQTGSHHRAMIYQNGRNNTAIVRQR